MKRPDGGRPLSPQAMNERRSTWVEAVALLHLIPGAMVLVAVSGITWIATLSTWSVHEALEGLRNALLMLLGFTLLGPVALAAPFFFVGLGIFRRRAWARFIALYLSFGLAGTGLLMTCSGSAGWGVVLLIYAVPTLGVLLLPPFAREFSE